MSHYTINHSALSNIFSRKSNCSGQLLMTSWLAIIIMGAVYITVLNYKRQFCWPYGVVNCASSGCFHNLSKSSSCFCKGQSGPTIDYPSIMHIAHPKRIQVKLCPTFLADGYPLAIAPSLLIPSSCPQQSLRRLHK